MSTTLTRKGSSGIIPQDVLRSMDPRDVQKAVSSTVIASRVYKVLNDEQIESLKKEQDGLHQFVEAMNVSLHIETRMRDASYSLIRLHESSLNIDAVKAANSQLRTTTFKMDQIVQKSQQAMWRLLAIQRLLLQHETAVLNAGLRRLDNENRDLARTVMNLDTARGQEKEEKLKWKKEHTRLKVQSILFPTSPIAPATPDSPLPPTPQLQLVQEQLSAMENYTKELSEDILLKDEKLVELKNELGAVKNWATDFETSIKAKKVIPAAETTTTPSEMTPQMQLGRLQFTIESDLKDMQVHVEELKAKTEQLTEENLALVSAAAGAGLCKKCVTMDSSFPTGQQQQERQARRSWRIRPGCSSPSPSLSPSLSPSDSSELHNILRESLWELDRQIELDERQQGSSCSGSGSGSSTPSSPSSSSSYRNSSSSTTSTSTAFSIDSNCGAGASGARQHGAESPLSVSRRSSSRSMASTATCSGGGGRLSRTSSTSSSSKFGLREQVLTRDMTSSPALGPEGLGQLSECDEEGRSDIERLNAIVQE
ncbi:hypothetical protein BGX33_003320 [Mortierella sp. NVP41]|nr:hypothetical protein BGX33_003320 [Mortierella sp. NVP41]